MHQIFRPLIASLSFLFVRVPDNAGWPTSIIIWFFRITTVSLILRTYLIPWLLARMSDHVRVRSISLRSIRGLYIRNGGYTWKVERIGYAFSSVQGSRRLAIKIDRPSLHITKDDNEAKRPTKRHYRRNLTLADLNPSPLARYAWSLLSSVKNFLEPYLRPLFRTYVVACLRVSIQWLPRLTQALSFDVHSVTVTFNDIPGAKILVEDISLNASLSLTYIEQSPKTEVQHVKERRDKQPSYGMGAWKKRMAESFQRSLDNALGESRGTGVLSFRICNILGTMPRSSDVDALNVPFLISPGVIDLGLSANFNPREGVLDTHGLKVSLKMGDCSAKVDLLNLLLEKALPKKPSSEPTGTVQSASLSSVSVNSPLASSFSMGSKRFGGPPSPSQSFASSFFSPASMFSPSNLISSQPLLASSISAQNLSPRSPSSPFLQAISASMRPRRHLLVQPPMRLKMFKDKSRLSVLKTVEVYVASISLSVLSQTKTGPYRAIIREISVDLALSDPATNIFHQNHLGSREKTDAYDLDAYTLRATFRQATLERESRHHIVRLARLGTFAVQVLAFQWPAPFLSPCSFIGNDPNSPFLGIHMELANVHVSERIQDLQQFLEGFFEIQQQFKEPEAPTASPPLCIQSFPVPRVYLAINCGSITGRIIYDADNGAKHRALELRSDGFTVCLNTVYQHPSLAIKRTFPAASSVQPLQFKTSLLVNLEPILVRVRSKHNFIGFGEPGLRVSDEDFLDDPPLLSVGMVEINASANAVAQMDGTAESIAVIDQASLIVDFSIAFDNVSVELWHPISVDAALRVLSIVPSKQSAQASSNPRPRFAILPLGLSTKFAIARFLVFVTAPDISPNDNMDLSRGFALHTSASMEYCSVRPNHDHWFDNVRRSKKRTLLWLPSETITSAIAYAKAHSPPADKSGFVKFHVHNLVLRAAVATQFEPDEPTFVGREDMSNASQELLRIDSALFDICLSCKGSPDRSRNDDFCDISGQVPFIKADFQLAHIYSILLGLQTVRLINPPRSSSVPSTTTQGRTKIVLSIQGNVTTIQGSIALPTQNLIVRIDGLRGYVDTRKSPRLQWTKVNVFVLLPPQVNHWEEPSEGRWDEFVSLHAWEVTFTQVADSLCISIDGDSARLRIPHGFVLAHLVHDASVVVKAIKHISHMASAGCYSETPSPEPEHPKSVPPLTIRLTTLCLEAQDDPFETKLGLIWKTGVDAVKQRMDREAAFQAKVEAVVSAQHELSSTNPATNDVEHEYQFDARHSVSIQEARARLDAVHALDWTLRLEQARKKRLKEENAILHTLFGPFTPIVSASLLESMKLPAASSEPPLLRVMLQNLCLTISPPTFNLESLPDALYNLGSGLPRDTKFSLLIPLHIHFTLSSLRVTLRDYPLPLLNIFTPSSSICWTFDTDLVIGEEMGTEASVDWVTCPIIDTRQARHGEAPFAILIPKTIMPVKTYAAPVITVTTPEPTLLSWGVSYGPAIQDVMRIIDSLSSSPRDPSPHLGFWDKMRLVFHWTFKITFCGDVRLYIKGSRDPYNIDGAGSGFVLCWQGNPEIRVGHENPQRELIQVISDGMLIAVPDLTDGLFYNNESTIKTKPFEKVCARLSSGVRYGIGFVLERSCGPECPYQNCSRSPFHRQCRYFSFRPHYDVKLEMKASPPSFKSQDDSYNGFRSDFIHLSLSLASSIKAKGQSDGPKTSNLYLTPKVFAHFWSWCSLFEGTLTLPIRQGNYHPSRPITPKLGRHLATLKYRISLRHLYILHGYIDEARETWVDGVTPWVGLKGKIDELQADLHQREEESTIPGPIPNTTRTVRKKPFYAAEVIMKGLELRALLAIFSESMKQHAGVSAPPQRSNYRKHTNLPVTRPSSLWFDLEDFIELDWTAPDDPPVLHLLPLAACPHFTYFKRNEALSGSPQTSKFGSEHSHICLLGKEPSVPKTQIALANSRAAELRRLINVNPKTEKTGFKTTNARAMMKMVTLLEEYINVLKEVEIKPESAQEKVSQSYHIPADIVSSDEWAEFDNVYQIHCPSIFMDSAVRDIVIQYYYCSRDRRGFEYHMATRAVKFIRDQANVTLMNEALGEEPIKSPTNPAQLAAFALRKMLKGENIVKSSVDIIRNSSRHDPTLREIDPLEGWTESVSLCKSHCCLLLKPQIVLRGEGPADTCIVAAAQAKLQSFGIMDPLNMDDPISGKIMSRNYTSLAGLQVFSPTDFDATASGSVPLEVLVDLRCESDAFERLVPQTDAIFHYDKFNRLRLRNKITSIITKAEALNTSINDSHLQNQTDLIRFHIPRFTVSASSEHLEAISNIVTKLLLFSDPAHKIRLDRLETLIFTYDFTDLDSASQVVSRLQSRLRSALETERLNFRHLRRLDDEDARLNMLQLKAHIFTLSEELNLLFDSIKMAQDRFDDQADQKSALLLHASSSEISWRMLDSRRNLLSKLVVTDIHFHWLSRQDSSTVNNLTIGNLTALDGSRYALWAEILSKYDEPPNHPLLKRGLFLSANWVVLAPVGGITIYETFELSFHPLRLQIDAKVGRRIREYIWPDRKEKQGDDAQDNHKTSKPAPEIMVKSPGRSSFDSPRVLQTQEFAGGQPAPLLRKLGSSRSFTDLRSSAREESMVNPPAFLNAQGFLSPPAFLKRTHSSDSVNFGKLLDAPPTPAPLGSFDFDKLDGQQQKGAGDAQVMKNRSSQKSFVLVRISSLHLLLSVVKEGSFECHDAKIKTRELEYRNQTWSFEELVNEFIPSNMSWRGWIKMAFHQPLVPVLPVARELLAKTKWTASKATQAHDSPLMLLHPQIFSIDDDRRLTRMQTDVGKKVEGSKSGWRNPLRFNKDPPSFTSLPLTAEPESMESEGTSNPSNTNVDPPSSRRRVKSLFSNKNLRQPSKTRDSDKRQSEELLKNDQ